MDRLTERELIIDASLANLDAVLDTTEEVASSCGASAKTVKQCQLAIEELFVNVANYAYPDGEGMACIRVSHPDDLTFWIELSDDGIPYDPSSKKDPDVTVPLKKRGIGGMGIFMAKKIMDEMIYERREGQNHLTLIKKLKGGNEVG